MSGALEWHWNLRGGTETYHRLLHINLLPPRKAEVSNLGGQVLSDQHIPGSQVSVDELQAWSESGKTRDEQARDSWASDGSGLTAGLCGHPPSLGQPLSLLPSQQGAVGASCLSRVTLLAIPSFP